MWLPLYPFNIYNIQNPKTHAPQKGKYKMSILVFQSWVNFQVCFGLEYGKFWSFGKLQSFRSSSLLSVAIRIKLIWIGVKRYGQNTKTSQNISMLARIFSIFGSNEFLSFLSCFHTSLSYLILQKPLFYWSLFLNSLGFMSAYLTH